MIMPYSRVYVECYAGHRGEEEPRRFSRGDRMRKITAILDRWMDPDHRYFKVRSDDGGIYILRHDPNAGEWELSVQLEGKAGPPDPW